MAAEVRVTALGAVNERQGLLKSESGHHGAKRLAGLVRVNNNRFAVKVLLQVLCRLGVSEGFGSLLRAARRFELLLVLTLLNKAFFREQCVIIRNIQSFLAHMLAPSG
ncbi:hypothetical protein D3C73_1447910 [compost metagenome]